MSHAKESKEKAETKIPSPTQRLGFLLEGNQPTPRSAIADPHSRLKSKPNPHLTRSSHLLWVSRSRKWTLCWQDRATPQAGIAQAASEQALGMLHMWGSTAGGPQTPPTTRAGSGVDGRRMAPQCASPGDASIFSKHPRDADGQSVRWPWDWFPAGLAGFVKDSGCQSSCP